MLFYPKNNQIFKRIYYDEQTSILFVFYNARKITEFYKIDRVFFYRYILPYIQKNQDFRQVLNWGIHERLAAKITQHHKDINVELLKHLTINK